jgi:hypothetical protein
LEADQGGTLERLKALRDEFIDPKIADHRGRIVKTIGDGMLVEFASVVDAVRCAVAVQQTMPVPDAGVVKDNRIGIKLGDIIVEADDLYGDGVNVVARIGLPSWNGAAPRSCPRRLQSYAAIYADHFDSCAGQKLEVTWRAACRLRGNGSQSDRQSQWRATCVLRLETVTR